MAPGATVATPRRRPCRRRQATVPISHRGRSVPSRRLAKTIRVHDVKGERAIALAQARHRRVDARAAYGRLARHPGPGWLGPRRRSARSSSARPSAGLLTTDDQLPECMARCAERLRRRHRHRAHLELSVRLRRFRPVVMIKPPAFAILLLIVGVRALRFHPRPIVVTGLAAVAGWSLLVCAATLTNGADALTADYRTYLASLQALPVAEMVRLATLAGLVAVLAIGTRSARRVLGRAAHASGLQRSAGVGAPASRPIGACAPSGPRMPLPRSMRATPS